MNLLPQNTENDIVFTRYLYLKSCIPYTLEKTLEEKRNLEESIFWAYEMYFSGFEDEIMMFVVYVFIPYYFKDVSPHLIKYSEKKYKEWKHTREESTLASILKNIIYVYKSPTARRFTSLKEEEYGKLIKPVQKEDTNPPNKILAHKCVYRIIYKSHSPGQESHLISDERYDELLAAFRENWLYFASGSAIWEERIKTSGGRICHENKCVIFANEEGEEDFYEKFGYEPDEQNFTIYEKCLGIQYFQD